MDRRNDQKAPGARARRFRTHSAIAAGIEAEAYEQGWPIEMAVELAVQFCDDQNDEAGLSHASDN